MKINTRLLALLVLAFTVLSGSVAHSANAFEYWGRGGRWVHDRHEGRLGWWWIVGPSWYYYPRPYAVTAPQTVIIQQPVQQPQQVVIEQAAPQVANSPVLYYCKSTETYYPDTMTCPGGWSTQIAGTPPK
jgi:hypothetical protein